MGGRLVAAQPLPPKPKPATHEDHHPPPPPNRHHHPTATHDHHPPPPPPNRHHHPTATTTQPPPTKTTIQPPPTKTTSQPAKPRGRFAQRGWVRCEAALVRGPGTPGRPPPRRRGQRRPRSPQDLNTIRPAAAAIPTGCGVGVQGVSEALDGPSGRSPLFYAPRGRCPCGRPWSRFCHLRLSRTRWAITGLGSRTGCVSGES